MRIVTTLILSFLLSGLGTSSLTQVSISGNWDSVLKVGDVKLRLVLKISDGPNGQLHAVMDSPDQGASDLEVDTITFQNNVLRFEMKKLLRSEEHTSELQSLAYL